MVGIYKFTNIKTGKSYIGQSVDIKRRYNHHKRLASLNESSPEYLFVNSQMRLYGFENFQFSVLEECQESELNEREKYYIEKYNTVYPHGYNFGRGGKSGAFNKIDSIDKVIEIQTLLKETTLTEKQIGELYGISDMMVSCINTGKSWADLTIQYPIRKYRNNIDPSNKAVNKCKCCGVPISGGSKSGLCFVCVNQNKRFRIPSKEVLYDLLLKNGYEEIGRKYGVSGNAVKKWCIGYSLPSHRELVKRVVV